LLLIFTNKKFATIKISKTKLVLSNRENKWQNWLYLKNLIRKVIHRVKKLKAREKKSKRRRRNTKTKRESKGKKRGKR
jgi:hypothetical protein